MLTTGSITTETFSAALLGLEDLSLRVTAAALSEVLEWASPVFVDSGLSSFLLDHTVF